MLTTKEKLNPNLYRCFEYVDFRWVTTFHDTAQSNREPNSIPDECKSDLRINTSEQFIPLLLSVP